MADLVGSDQTVTWRVTSTDSVPLSVQLSFTGHTATQWWVAGGVVVFVLLVVFIAGRSTAQPLSQGRRCWVTVLSTRTAAPL
jgi:uncharacterized membrane protein